VDSARFKVTIENFMEALSQTAARRWFPQNRKRPWPGQSDRVRSVEGKLLFEARNFDSSAPLGRNAGAFHPI